MNNGYGYAGAYNANGNGNGHDNGIGDGQQDANMMMMDQEALLGGSGQSLDDIVNQNAKLIRRQSMPQTFGSNAQHPDMRRISMMDYGSSSPGAHSNNYQFDTSTAMDQSGYGHGGMTPTASNNQQRPSMSRPGSVADLSLDTGYINSSQAYGSMMPPNSAYARSPAPNALDMSMGSPYIDASMAMNMDYGVDQGLGNSMPGDAMMANVYGQQNYNQPSSSHTPMHGPSSTAHGTPLSGKTMTPDHGGQSVHQQYGGSTSGGTPNTVRHQSRPQSLHVPDMNSPAHGASPLSQPPMLVQSQMMPQSSPQNPQPQHSPPHQSLQQQQSHLQRPQLVQQQHNTSSASFTPPAQRSHSGNSEPGPAQGQHPEFDPGTTNHVPSSGTPYNPNNQGFAWDAPEGGWPSTMTGKPHMSSVYKNAYSSTGFDMLGVLVSLESTDNRPTIPLT